MVGGGLLNSGEPPPMGGGGVLNCGEAGWDFASGVFSPESSRPPSSALLRGGGVSRLSSTIRSGLGDGVRSLSPSPPLLAAGDESLTEDPPPPISPPYFKGVKNGESFPLNGELVLALALGDDPMSVVTTFNAFEGGVEMWLAASESACELEYLAGVMKGESLNGVTTNNGLDPPAPVASPLHGVLS